MMLRRCFLGGMGHLGRFCMKVPYILLRALLLFGKSGYLWGVMQILHDIKCSRCGAVNKSVQAWVGEELIRRCNACGHNKVMAMLSTSSEDSNYTIVRAIKAPLMEMF